ncbi:MAG: YihY/virulence factor BrkB family protein [Bacilli bacterium]|nr:YihY/virulence factor BrkB family protein [Bacilli bacterium]
MIKGYLKRILNLITRPEMKILPGQLAYFIILSMFPLLTLFGYIGSKTLLFLEPLINVLGRILPSNVMQIILPFIEKSHITGNVAFFMIIGFILVSNGTYSIIITANELYGIHNSDYIKDRIKAFFMIILLMILFTFAFVVLAYGNIIVKEILDLKLFSTVSKNMYALFVLLKWPVAFIFVFWLLNFLYTIAPDERIPSRLMNKGSLFTTIGFVLVTFIYSFYVSYLANYSLFYGSISGIIVMMIWVYMLSYIFVMGIAINVDEYNIFKNENKNLKNDKNK